MPKIIALSDTHNRHESLYIPPGDILIHAGDYSGYGSPQELMDFNIWLGTLGFQDVVVIDGNHDGYAAGLNKEFVRKLFTNATYLQDEEVTIQGLRIYGSPYTPTFGSWSYMKDEPELATIFDKIPQGLDILVTHGPPHGILDTVGAAPYLRNVGSTALLKRVLEVKPKMHIWGHIHEGRGSFVGEFTRSYNVSAVDEYYHPHYGATEIDI